MPLSAFVARVELEESSKYLFGVPRMKPQFPVVTVDSGCSRPMMSSKCFYRMRQQNVAMDLMRFNDVHPIETGKGVVHLTLGVRFSMRVPIWAVNRDGIAHMIGFMPVSQVATINPYLPVDFLWGNTSALTYNGVWEPWSGRYWLDCPMRNRRVFVQCAYTTHLSVVWPLLAYTHGDDLLHEREWLGKGPLSHNTTTFPLFERAKWSKQAYLMRYDAARKPTVSGAYEGRPNDALQDPFAFRADGTTNGVWITPQKVCKRDVSANVNRPLSLSNAFTALADRSDA